MIRLLQALLTRPAHDFGDPACRRYDGDRHGRAQWARCQVCRPGAEPCAKPGCPVGLHYHYGYGQRYSSLTPVIDAFSTGQPFVKEG